MKWNSISLMRRSPPSRSSRLASISPVAASMAATNSSSGWMTAAS